MNYRLITAASTCLGVICGFVIGCTVTKNMCTKRFNEDLKKVRDQLIKPKDEPIKKEDTPVESKEVLTKPETFHKSSIDMDIYKSTLNKNKYIMNKPPYVIKAEDFDSYNSYDKVDLTYYEGDDTLADDMDDVVLISDTIGDNLKHMGEEETDTLYVRNDRMGTDYRVTRSPGSYSVETGLDV